MEETIKIQGEAGLGNRTHIGRVARIRLLEGPRDRHRRARVAVAATRHAHLRARDVELRDPRRPRVVDGQRLDPQQVLAVGDARRDGARVRVWLEQVWWEGEASS